MLEKQGQVDLYPAGQNAIADILKNWTAAEVSVETLTEAVAKFLAAVAIERKLAGRQQADAIYLVGGPLGFRVEGAQGLDFVVEQVDAIGSLAAHGVEVQQ